MRVKPKIVMLESVDRAGKDTLWDEIDKQTKYKHIVIDRVTIGFKAYCDIFQKDEELKETYQILEEELSKLESVLVIYIDCSTEELIRRCVNTNHEILDFDEHKKIYRKTFDESLYKNKIIIDTTNKHAKEIVQDLIKKGVL